MQKIHHKTLKVICQSNKTYAELLGVSQNFHYSSTACKITEVYKRTSYLNSKFVCSFFYHKEIPYNIRKGQMLLLPPARSTYYGSNSVHFQVSLIWSISVCEFKNNINDLRDIDIDTSE